MCNQINWEFSRSRRKKYPLQVAVGPWWSPEYGGRLWGKRLRLVFLCSSLQYLVPRNGHCLRAKLNLNETKRGWCRGCSMAETTTEGGGECWQPSNERVPCQKGGMIPHNKVWWHSLLPVSVLFEQGVHTSKERTIVPSADFVHMSDKWLCMYAPEVLVECHHL